MLDKLTKAQKKKICTAIKYYAYSAIVAIAVTYTSGHQDLNSLINAAILAILGPIAAAGNPKDSSYGIGSKDKDTDAGA